MRRGTFHRSIAMFLSSLLWFASAIYSQTVSSGSVLGVVTDSSGGAVTGALVTLRNIAEGTSDSVPTDANGNYSFPVVRVGRYQLAVNKDGFKQYVQTEFPLNAAEFVRINVNLTVGQVSEQVTVTDAPPIINTVTASEGNTISGHQANELPLTNRVFTQLVLLEPGVVDTLDKNPGFGSNAGINFSVNGAGSDQNNLMFDGVRNLDTFGGNAFITPNLFAVSEIRIESNSYSATTGRNAGAQVNVVSRAGGNNFHGNAFEFFRNNVMNARNFFGGALPVPENRYNDFGYDIGGPILKNRLFFFWSQEWRRIINSAGPQRARVATAAERTGNFSADCPPPGTPFSQANFPFCPAAATDPNTSLATGFPNNQLPSLDPNAVLLLNTYFPPPTPGFQDGIFNFISEKPDFTRWRQESLRLDFKATDKLNMYLRLTQDHVLLQNPYGLGHENVLPDVGSSTQDYPIYHASFHVAYTPRPTFTSEFTFGIYFDNDRSLRNGPLSCRCRAPGLNIKEVFPLNELDRIPSLSFSGGYAGIAEIWFFHNYSYSYPLQTDNTWTKGIHTVKFGVSFSPEGKSELANPSNNNTNGSFNFIGNGFPGSTGDSLADFLLGRAFQYTETAVDPFGKYRWYNLEPYAEDQIRLRRNLTLTLGLRWEYYSPEYEKNNFFASFDPAFWDPNKAPQVSPIDGSIVPGTGNPLNGIIVAGKNSPYGRALFPSHKNGWAPRLGIVWDPTSDGKTAVRAGYGIYYDRWASYSQFGELDPPLNNSVNIINTSLSNPGGTPGTQFPPFLNMVVAPWKYPQIQKWSLSVQREVWKNTSFSIAYVGTKGTHLLGALNPNQLTPNAGVANGALLPDPLRPFRGYSGFTAYSTQFDSSYHALQMVLLHRLEHGLEFQASFTHSRSITDSSGAFGAPPENEHNIAAERGPAGNNVPNVLALNAIWDVPFSHNYHGVAKLALDGWQISTLANIQSGFPLTPFLFNDNEGVGGGLERPNQVGNPNNGPKTVAQWFNTAAFALPQAATFGTASNGAIKGPGAINWDMGLGKNFPIRESVGFRFRAQAFNVFNHPSFNGVDLGFQSPTFGQVISTLSPRILQLALDLTF